MMLRTTFALFLCLLVAEELVLLQAEPTWTSLRVTYGLNLLSSHTFAKIPRTEAKARSKGYNKLPGECSGKFLGYRYTNGPETDVVTLYDSKGYIAGLQFGIPKHDVQTIANGSSFDYDSTPAFQLDRVGENDIYFLTAYFVDPSIICNEGRTRDEFEDQGTGTGLYIQNGTHPIRDSIHIPLYEQGMNVTNWVLGKCFPTMGVHYWYQFSSTMSCRNVFPITAIYNRGKLTSFAFLSFGKFEFSNRFEHPPEYTLKRFMPDDIPQCIKDEYEASGGFTTMHVFFSIRPWNILC